jgi:hypothetical protein
MAIKTAEASLTSIFVVDAITGFIPWRQGFIDPETGYIRADASSRWNAVTSWSAFTSYNQTYKQIRWTSNQVDLGEIKDFTMKIETDYDGELFFIVHTSQTGLFQGEETELVIENGTYDVSSFYARYVYVTAIVSGTELRKMTITTSSEQSQFRFFNVNTSTLPGTSSERILSLENPLSAVKEVIITPQAPSAYAVDMYVSDTATSRVLIPVVFSKGFSTGYFVNGYITDDYLVGGAQITFALYGIDNQPRDSIVDISMRGLPKQAMIGGNLLTIA